MGKKRKEAHEKIKSGRPRIQYTTALGQSICDAIATTPNGLDYICYKNPEFPCPEVIYYWIAYNEDFSKRYLDAKQRQIETHMEHTYNIADRATVEDVALATMHINLRKWHASRLMPKKYGEKFQAESVDSTSTELTKTIDKLQEQLEVLKKHEQEY